MGVTKTSSRSFALSADQISAMVSTALNKIGASIQDQHNSTFTAKTRTSIRSFGEHITVEVQATSADSCQVDIESSCSVKTTMVDWGKNQKNIDKFFAALEKLAASQGRQPVFTPPTAPAKQESKPAKKLKIFISYRREDSRYVTGRIYDNLLRELSTASIYKDVDSIPLGEDFREHIRKSVEQCDILLAVIGDHWAVTKDGINRLQNKKDWVRIEIESALQRDIPVIPLLIDEVDIPDESLLPEPLKSLQYRNGMPIRPDPDFHNDIRRLIEDIKRKT